MKPNKLTISRKGFDSGSGGCLSPIFSDGTMFSLPIPSWDQEAFEDLQHGDIDIASVVTGVTNGRMSGQNLIHVDPDLNFEAYRHRKERANWQHWRGMLGHAGNRRYLRVRVDPPQRGQPQLQTPVTPPHNRRIIVCTMPAFILLRHRHPSPTIRPSRSKTR